MPNRFRFTGRCPYCSSVVGMSVLKKSEPRHPVTEWRGRCPQGHDVHLQAFAAEGEAYEDAFQPLPEFPALPDYDARLIPFVAINAQSVANRLNMLGEFVTGCRITVTPCEDESTDALYGYVLETSAGDFIGKAARLSRIPEADILIPEIVEPHEELVIAGQEPPTPKPGTLPLHKDHDLAEMLGEYDQ